MSIFARLCNFFSAKVNDQIDKAEVADPEAMIKQIVRTMEESVRKATESVGMSVANEKGLERQIRERKEQSKTWKDRAELAVRKSEDLLAKSALERFNILQAAVKELSGTLTKSQKTTEELKTQLIQLRTKLDKAKTEQASLVARCKSARSRKAIAEAMAGIGDDAFSSFERFRQRIDEEEAIAEAQEEVEGTKANDEFADMEQAEAVEKQLEDLKRKVSEEA